MKSPIDLDNLPALPGVYLFKDHTNAIIYIGKAVSLKARIKSYFAEKTRDWKLDALLKEIDSVDTIITSTEEEALILEAQLIRDKQPKFNVLLRDGQPFVYFLITKEELPRLTLVRNKKEKGTYFGPFLQKQHARRVLEFLEREFQLKYCNKKIETGCLDFHFGLCAGTCMTIFNEQDYRFRLELVQQLLKKDFDTFIATVNTKIALCIQQLEFERAQHLHKYIENFSRIQHILESNFSLAHYAGEIIYASSKLSRNPVRPSDIGYQLQQFLQLEHEPRTIDCFDISHFQSRWLVGSCVRFTNGNPEQNKFRRFRIKTLTEQNDYAALQEIVMRRYRNPEDIPDLILIDGGKGQLSAVQSVLPQAHCISLAKKEEKVFSSRFREGIHLDQASDVGKLLMAIRDYAHHFAISYHRSKQTPFV